jgi:hypothetical protein
MAIVVLSVRLQADLVSAIDRFVIANDSRVVVLRLSGRTRPPRVEYELTKLGRARCRSQ